VEIMTPITKLSKQIVSGNQIPPLVREVFKFGEEERPGAVHLELPEDIAVEIVPLVDSLPFPRSEFRRPIPDEKAILQAVELITTANRPLLLIGAAANRQLTAKMLRELIDKTGFYFFNTQMGKGVVDESHPKFLQTAALSANDFVHKAIEKVEPSLVPERQGTEESVLSVRRISSSMWDTM